MDKLKVNSKRLSLVINKAKTEVMYNQFSLSPTLTIDDEEIKIKEP